MSLTAIDLFCGAGGTSTGILKAARQLRRPIQLTAVNHWPTAINTHSLNHPTVRHLCEPVENLHPLDLVKSRHLDLLAASCECRYHSNARGGGPCNEQSRSQAWQLIRWATDINVDHLMMENVREFLDWGPLLTKAIQYQGRRHKKDRPDPRHKGKFFRSFINALRERYKHVEWKIQVAADYGDPTSRRRFILIAGHNPIIWPDPSHGPGRANPWRTARECIDWSLKGTSIFARKKPLCANTLRRIEAGLRKFGGQNAEPFIVCLRGTREGQFPGCAQSINDPLTPITAGGRHHVLCEPFVIGQQSGATPRSADEPLPTVATAGAIRLVEPFLAAYHNGPRHRVHSISEPLRTQDTSNRYALVEPIVVKFDQQGDKSSCSSRITDPLPTVVTKQNMLLVEPLVVKYYKTGRCKPVTQPLDSITTKARFMLVECATGREVAELDIRTRMLQPHELAAAHSFPADYQFTGNQEDQTKQIGNSVPVELAAAHARAILA